MMLYIFADKYLQEDLCEKCVRSLNKRIKQDNVYKILDFAHERNISETAARCFSFFQNRLTINNIAGLIEYVERKEDSELDRLKNIAFSFVLDRFFDIYENEKGNMQLYESFLIVNIEMDNLSTFVDFLSNSYKLAGNEIEGSDSEEFHFGWRGPKTKDIFDERTIKIKEAVFDFIHENVNTVMTRKVSEDFSKDFFRDFTKYVVEKTSKQIQNLIMKNNQIEMSEETDKKQKENGKKRMEPVQDGSVEEKPILKKSK